VNIGITGATGLIGTRIIDLALRRGHEVVAFSRHPERAIPGCEMREFTLEAAPDIRGCEALIHLAGETIAERWSEAKKQRIVESRVLGTARVVEAIGAAVEKPEVLLCGSAVGFYGDGGDADVTETAAAGSGFLSETVQAWETEAHRAKDVRIVLLRTGIVLGKEGGALPQMALPFRFGLGATLGDGRQWMSWIHLDDVAQLSLFAIENLDIRGPLNASAPWPVRNEEFTRALATTLHRPALFRVPAFALRVLFGEFSRELLDSKRVLPAVATEHGFRFQFPELAPALKDLLG
jgi:uncharacterized protein (TIGR01777 family)